MITLLSKESKKLELMIPYLIDVLGVYKSITIFDQDVELLPNKFLAD